MKRRYRIGIAGAVLLAALAVGKIAGHPWLAAALAALRSTDHFHSLDQAPAVRYEEGAKELALLVAPSIESAVATVERAHGQPFAEPVVVYITATRASFRRLAPAKGDPRGLVFNRKLLLSPKLAAMPERIVGTLTHELSHLHLNQHLGNRGFGALPTWFREGLATYVSGGGGAEAVSDGEATEALRTGKRFTPEASGSFLFPKSASSYGISPHLFYRQAAMFLRHVHTGNAKAFQRFLSQLLEGQEFDRAFSGSFSLTVDEAWQRFLRQLERA